MEIGMDFTLIATGGTIDKDYASSSGTYNFKISSPSVGKIFEKANPNFEYEILSVLKKDSLDMDDDDDRKKVLAACRNAKTDRIIISHGTDTIAKTAESLNEIEDKLIILFGAAKPQIFSNTDADFNLGVAIGALNALDRGIYIAMNGCIYRLDKCRKDKKTGRFVERQTI